MILPHGCLRTKNELGFLWLQIFSHRVTNNNYFSDNEKEILFTNQNGMFSILGAVTEDFKIDDYYEFLLQYPNEIVLKDQYNHWKQKVFPLNSNSSSPDIGYEPLDISWDYLWEGLSRSGEPLYSFIEGCQSLDEKNPWWFAIGVKSTNTYNNAIPGPTKHVEPLDGYQVKYVELWIRIPEHLVIAEHKKVFKPYRSSLFR